LGSDNELGTVNIAGADATQTGANALNNGTVVLANGAKLNATGHAVNVTDAGLESDGSLVGPLTAHGAAVQVGRFDPSGMSPPGSLAAPSATFDSASVLTFELGSPGSGGELSSTGNVNLGGASLAINGCHAYSGAYTLVSAGTLTGAFANAPEGSQITNLCTPGIRYTIHYTAQTVTATVVSSGGGGGGPGGGGTTGGSGSSSGGAGSNSSSGPSTGQIKAALRGVLTPKGKLARISALLRHGGYTFKFNAPSAGKLVIQWYQVPKGAHLARKRKPRPVLVASVTISVSKAGTIKVKVKLTGKGRRLLKHAKKLKLTAKDSFKPSGSSATTMRKAFILRR
jgi:hypothetical protein